MAKSKKKKNKSPKSTSKTAGNKKKGEENKPQKHAVSIILMATAILFFCLVLIPAGSVWGAVHKFLLGFFGIIAYVVPFILGYLSVLIALDKPMKSISSKLWQSLLLVLMLTSMVHVFIFDIGGNYLDMIKTSFAQGMIRKGGGVLGSILGYPLEYFLTDVGAKILIILLSFVFFMLVTGTTLVTLFKGIVFPVKKAKETISDVIETSQAEKAERDAKKIDFEPGGDLSDTDMPGLKREKSEKLKAFEQIAKSGYDESLGKGIDIPLYGENNVVKDISLMDDKMEKESQAQVGGIDIARELQKKSSLSERDEKYNYPPLSLLDKPKGRKGGSSIADEQETAELLVKTLDDFGISTKVVNVSRGPSVTRYDLEPSAGVKISRITGLADDIALRLATTGVRIEAPIPNKAAVGIEVPNRARSNVQLSELIGNPKFEKEKSKLTVALGKDISGNVVYADLTEMPHLLIAGTTGSGKSVCTNAMIQSVLFRASPNEVRMILVDPKQVEFGVYNDVPHLLVPVVTDPRKAAGALGWAVTEMLERYKIFAENNVRDIASYNKLAEKREDLQKKPLILIVIDELSDLMMAAANEVEDAIIRLAQMARAAGMHLVIATQRPSVDVITGLIKANIPSRLALTVASAVDSRTILDSGGAEKLLGRGDMLFMPIGKSKPIRVQGCFVSNNEVESVVGYLKKKEEFEYDEEVIEEIERQAEVTGKGGGAKADVSEDDVDELYDDAVKLVVEAGEASTSMLQRRLRVGYARAGRLIDDMEQRGIVGPHAGSKPREVLIDKQRYLEMKFIQEDKNNEE